MCCYTSIMYYSPFTIIWHLNCVYVGPKKVIQYIPSRLEGWEMFSKSKAERKLVSSLSRHSKAFQKMSLTNTGPIQGKVRRLTLWPYKTGLIHQSLVQS